MADDSNDIRIEELSPEVAVAIRVREPMASVDVGRIFGEAMGRLGARLGSIGVSPAGPPFARYHDWGRQTADIEIGFPLDGRPLDLADLTDVPAGEVGVSSLPGGEAAIIVHRGPYPTLGEAYRRLAEWIRAHGREEGGAPWESYLDDPATVEDVGTLRTAIVWPLAEVRG